MFTNEDQTKRISDFLRSLNKPKLSPEDGGKVDLNKLTEELTKRREANEANE